MDAGVQLSEVYSTIEKLQEVNPMLGFRGCRLGITYPEITEMQVREAISAFGHQGHTGCAWVPLPEPGHTHVISCFHWGQVTLSDLVINVLLLGVRLLANPLSVELVEHQYTGFKHMQAVAVGPRLHTTQHILAQHRHLLPFLIRRGCPALRRPCIVQKLYKERLILPSQFSLNNGKGSSSRSCHAGVSPVRVTGPHFGLVAQC